MIRTFDVVQSLSGQRNAIVIPRPYIRFFAGDQQAYVLGAILNQIVFWSGVDSSAADGWFYKSHKEMGEDLEGLSEDQVSRLTNKLCTKYFPGIIETKSKKVNGTPTTHYRIDGDAIISKIFPSYLDSAKVRSPKREDAESKSQKRGTETEEARKHGNRESAESFLYTDHDSDKNKQINKPFCPPAAPTDGEEFISERLTREATEIVKHLSTLTNVTFELTDGNLQHIRARLRNATATKTEMLVVVDHLVACWLGTKYARGLNPSTIFSSDKFSSNLLAAKAWDTAGRPACSSEAKAENSPSEDTAERDAAYRRFISGVGVTKAPSPFEKLVCAEASKANVRTMQAAYSQPRWNQIWKECAARKQGVKAA